MRLSCNSSIGPVVDILWHAAHGLGFTAQARFHASSVRDERESLAGGGSNIAGRSSCILHTNHAVRSAGRWSSKDPAYPAPPNLDVVHLPAPSRGWQMAHPGGQSFVCGHLHAPLASVDDTSCDLVRPRATCPRTCRCLTSCRYSGTHIGIICVSDNNHTIHHVTPRPPPTQRDKDGSRGSPRSAADAQESRRRSHWASAHLTAP